MKNLFLIAFLAFFFSCDMINGTKTLGSGYYFDTDAIIYAKTETYNGVGVTVIPAKVLSYSFDDNFVIVSSSDNSNETKFWIIEKEKEKREIQYIESNANNNSYYQYSNIIGPMDKSEFTAKTNELGLNLKFEE